MGEHRLVDGTAQVGAVAGVGLPKRRRKASPTGTEATSPPTASIMTRRSVNTEPRRTASPTPSASSAKALGLVAGRRRSRGRQLCSAGRLTQAQTQRSASAAVIMPPMLP